jgi:hypothetical protein
MADEQTPYQPGDQMPPEDLTVLYCGGCNPHIDRAAVAAEVRAPEDAPSGGTLYLSGCPRACASDHRLTADGHAAVVAGATVDGVPTEPGDLASAVRAKLKE